MGEAQESPSVRFAVYSESLTAVQLLGLLAKDCGTNRAYSANCGFFRPDQLTRRSSILMVHAGYGPTSIPRTSLGTP